MFDLNTRILVVDDMLTMRKLVSKVCRDIGFKNLVEAADGAVAWEMISAAVIPIQLVISDWNMPVSSGLDLLKRVRTDNRFKELPFVMLTAESEQNQVIEAVLAGVSNYIVKPFSAQILKEKLDLVYKRAAS